MSRKAAWIHSTTLTLSGSGRPRRQKSEELDDLTLRSKQVQRISKLSDSVERFLLRCLSSR